MPRHHTSDPIERAFTIARREAEAVDEAGGSTAQILERFRLTRDSTIFELTSIPPECSKFS